MFTLKMQRDPDTPQAGDTTWLTGIEWVELMSRHDIAHWEDLQEINARYVEPIRFVVTLTSKNPPAGEPAVVVDAAGNPRTKMVTLLLVKPEGKEPMLYLVQRAWLLGPDGQTIDRVAP